MNRVFLIFIWIPISANLCAQDSLGRKNFWSVKVGAIATIPTVNQFEKKFEALGAYSDFTIDPQYTIGSFIKTGYNRTLYFSGAYFILLKFLAGYQRSSYKETATGEYWYSEFSVTSYKGTVNSVITADMISFGFAPTFSVKICKNSYISNTVGIFSDLIIHQYKKTEWNGIKDGSPVRETCNASRWEIIRPSIHFDYVVGLIYKMKNGMLFMPTVETTYYPVGHTYYYIEKCISPSSLEWLYHPVKYFDVILGLELYF